MGKSWELMQKTSMWHLIGHSSLNIMGETSSHFPHLPDMNGIDIEVGTFIKGYSSDN